LSGLLGVPRSYPSFLVEPFLRVPADGCGPHGVERYARVVRLNEDEQAPAEEQEAPRIAGEDVEDSLGELPVVRRKAVEALKDEYEPTVRRNTRAGGGAIANRPTTSGTRSRAKATSAWRGVIPLP
jgi:hypothetical protein